MGGVHVRSSVIIARVSWLLRHWGVEGMEKVLASMEPELASLVRGATDPSSWTPFPAFISLGEAIDRAYGSGDLEMCRLLGRHAASFNLPTLYRVFYRVGTVRFIFGKASDLWREQYDSGSIRTVEGGPHDVSLLIEDFATPHRVHCLSVLGWAEGAIALSGKAIVDGKEVRCRTRGDDLCELRIRYD